MDVEFIHKQGWNNVVPNVLNRKNEFQVERPLTKTQALKAIFQGENKLERLIKEPYCRNPTLGLSVRMKLTLPKVGTWSPPGLRKI
jgi:hypothetical protein